jgi:hypothetical protein
MKRKLTRPIMPSLLVAAALLFGAVAAYGQQTKDVVFGKSRLYDHSAFSLDLPSTWNVKDRSTTNETIISIMDPTENAVLVLHVWNATRNYSDDEKISTLKGFLTDSLGKFPAFTFGESKTQKDGSIGVYFKYDQELAGKVFPMYGDSFIDQKNGHVGIVLFVIPKEQYDRHKTETYKLINSFVIK